MNDLARRAFALVFAFLLVTSIPFAVVELGGPDVSPVEPASASHGGTHVDDFEDGDIAGWSGDTSQFEADSSDPISGTYSGKFTASTNSQEVHNSLDSAASPSRVGAKVRLDADNASGFTRVLGIRSGTSWVAFIDFEENGVIEVSDGNSENAVNDLKWAPGAEYSIELRNIDWSADTFDLYIDGEQVYSGATFWTSSSDFDEIRHRIDDSGATQHLYIDDVEYAGSNYSVTKFSDTDIEQFEDNDTTVEAEGFFGWWGDTGSLSTTSTADVGSFSGELEASSSDKVVNISSESGFYSPSRIAYVVNISGDPGTTSDRVETRIYRGSNRVIGIKFRGDGNIRVNNGGSVQNVGFDWVENTTYYVEAKNIDWSADTFDLFINGKKVQDGVSFANSASGISKIFFRADSSSSGITQTLKFDEIEFNGSDWTVGDYQTGLTNDFDDGNIETEERAYADEWIADSGDEGTLSHTTDSIDGSGAAVLRANGTNNRLHLKAVAEMNITELSWKTRINKTTNNAGDDVSFEIEQRGTGIIDIQFNQNGTLLATDGSFNTDPPTTGTSWANSTVYLVEVKDIDWSAETYDLYLDGSQIYDDAGFGNSADWFDEFHFRNDQDNGGSEDVGATLDTLKIGKCVDCTISGSGAGNTVSGTVENQHGDPIEGATVQVWGVDYDQITPDAGETKTQRATDLIEDAKNKTPTEWTDQIESDFRLTGSGGHFEEPDVVYAAVHSVDDWKVSPTTDQIKDNPTLDSPELSIDASRGETVTVAVSAWDGDKFVLRNAISPVRNDLHGEPIEASIVIETLVAPDDTLETTQTTKTELNCNFIGCDWSSAFVEVQLTPGFYRVYVKGHSEDSYVIKVGDPIEIIVEDIKNEQNQVADQAADVAQNLNDGKFTKTTTTTGPDGSWSVDVGSSVNTVAIQAYKAPDVELNDSDLTYEDIILEYEAAYEDGEQITRLGSVYLPSEVRSVDPPQSDVTLTVEETTFPQLADRTNLEQWLRDILEEMLNESLSDTTSAFQNRTEDVARSELESTYETLVDMYQNNAALRAIVDGLAEESDRELVIRENLDEVSDSQMRDTVDLIYEGLSVLGDASGGSDIDEDIGNDTISQVWTLPGDIEGTSINLLIHWSNGTTDSLSTESEYLSLDKRTGLADQVVLDEYPIGDEDPSSLTFELLYVTDDGQPGRDQNTIRNPRFDGDIPTLDAIELTSLEPGPSDQVDIEIHPKDAAKFGSIVSATVTGPGGSDISTDAISSNGRATGFKTDGSGVYHVALTFNNSDGDEFTETIRVRADDFNDQRPPSAQIRTGPTGRYLVVGDGLESGSIDVSDDGRVSVAARIPQDADVPGSVQLYLQEVNTGSRTEVTVSVVRGETESRVSQRVGVILHMNQITETAVLYREDNEPLPRNGSNAAGEVNARDNGSTIQSFTEADGKVTILVENDPSIVERALYRIRGFDLPGLSVAPIVEIAGLFGTSLVGIEHFLDPHGAAELLDGVIP